MADTRKRTADEPQVTKRRVTMTAYVADPVSGEPRKVQAVDYVLDEVRAGVHVLDTYVADARRRWQAVEVSDEYDAGPGGYHGATFFPDTLDHPLSGVLLPATTPKG